MWDFLSIGLLQGLDLSFEIQGSIQPIIEEVAPIIVECKTIPSVSLNTTLGEGNFSTYI